MDSDFVNVLRDENERLRARIRDLERALFTGVSVPVEYGLTANEARIFGVLVNRPLATRAAIMAALYDDDGKEQAEPKIVDVFVCRMRRKLEPFGIEIHTRWGEGWFLPDTQRQQLSEAAE